MRGTLPGGRGPRRASVLRSRALRPSSKVRVVSPRWGSAPSRACPDALDGGEHVRFAPPQRRKATLSQSTLELANVLLAKREVVDEVDRILSVVIVDTRDVFTVDCLCMMHEGLEFSSSARIEGRSGSP